MIKVRSGLSGVVLASLMLVALSAMASDQDQRYAIKGVGRAECAAYVQAFDARSNDLALFAGWITGYLTALNQGLENTFDLAPWQSADVLLLMMRDLCGRNPQEPFSRVAGGLVNILGRDRLQTMSEMVEITNNEHKTALPREVLRQVQERLKAANHYTGTIDGAYGSGTRKAIEAFQQKQQLPLTGIPDQQTLVRLMYPPE